MGGTIHVVTGTPFTATFINATNTFTVPGDFTNMFAAGAILTALGGAPNGGYREVVSSVFGSGVTTVTSTSYAIGTAYPGPATFTTGTGSIIWFFAGSPPVSIDLISIGVNNSLGGLIALASDKSLLTSSDGTTWTPASIGLVTGDLTSIVGSDNAPPGNFIIVGAAGTMLESTDGTTWSSLTPITAEDLVSISFC